MTHLHLATDPEPLLFAELPEVPRIILGRRCIDALVDRAAALTGIQRALLIGRGGGHDVSLVRFAVMQVAREQGKSCGQIAIALKLRDASSVVHGWRRAVFCERHDPEFATLMRLLRESCDA